MWLLCEPTIKSPFHWPKVAHDSASSRHSWIDTPPALPIEPTLMILVSQRFYLAMQFYITFIEYVNFYGISIFKYFIERPSCFHCWDDSIEANPIVARTPIFNNFESNQIMQLLVNTKQAKVVHFGSFLHCNISINGEVFRQTSIIYFPAER